MLPRRCLSCTRIIRRGTRCADCRRTQKQPYTTSEYKRNRLAVLERDRYTCQQCGERATTADHIIPLAQGGRSTVENMRAACVACNSGKRDR